MKFLSPAADRAARRSLSGRVVILTLLVSAAFPLSAVAQAVPAPAAAPTPATVRLEKGKTLNWPLTLNNSCRKSHKFEVESRAKYIRFTGPKSAKLMPGASKVFDALIDATMLEVGKYRTSIDWKCPDCLKGETCIEKNPHQIVLDILVVEPRPVTSKNWTVFSHSDLTARFFKIVETALDEHNAKLTGGAKNLLSQMVDKGAANLAGQQTPEKLKEADGNLRAFIKKAVELAQAKNGKKSAGGMSFAFAAAARSAKIELDEEIIKQTQFALCPLFPFC